MNNIFLNIAGIPIKVCCEEFGSLDYLVNYLTTSGPVDHLFQIKMVEKQEKSKGKLIVNRNALRVYLQENRIIRYMGDVAESVDNAYLRTVYVDGNGVMEFRRNQVLHGISGKQIINGMDLPHLLTVHDGFLLHASFIEYEGKAILFTAPSQTGKSTQASLWCEYMGAELINGDRAAVRIIDGRVKACGIPFCGSSHVRKNKMLPLAAIVYLSQADENNISQMQGVKAFRCIWEGCTMNFWDTDDTKHASLTVSEVIEKVPVYHLSCTPDNRAVFLLKNALEEKNA